ncbi:MAG TPA: hypothetical protein PLG60_07065 [Acidimicrobiales bacterium]|nr:MAG: hypothetical protein B7X07_06200 [Actinobacteria bacterium 21-64-8]HQU00250.1 hypothetical protein [Acidimicrobiales bacterium]
MTSVPRADYRHLLSLSGPLGTFEHAKFAQPRREHGYCTDDVARVLLVAVREPDASDSLRELARTSMNFLRSAQARDGTFRNRRGANGVFIGSSSNRDWWGRAQWALGTAAARASDDTVRRDAMAHFTKGCQVVSPWPRANAFAVLGAAEVLRTSADHEGARLLITRALEVLDRPVLSAEWSWPEPRLTYANAALAEALLASGEVLETPLLVEQGLEQLEWLLARWSAAGHLSVVAAGGDQGAAHVVAYDQQPIEVAALGEACARAHTLTGDQRWRRGLELATSWFCGDNDGGVVMFDDATGGGYDGLTQSGVNLNQGAESTLALLATLQHAHVRAVVPVRA